VREAHNTFFIPRTSRTSSVIVGNQTIVKQSMYCTNCHHTNHNVETYINKKEEPIVAATKATTQAGKPPRPLNYPCHICGIVGHKLMNYPRFRKM
jgi:hypothetical protein